MEHAILHLLYARFFTKVLYDLGMVDFAEPFPRLLNQGQVHQRATMSKSQGNVVGPAGELEAYGVDAIRLTMVFAGPPEDDIDWADVSAHGSARFLARVRRLAEDVRAPQGADPASGDLGLRQVTHKTVARRHSRCRVVRFNVAVARVMELVNATRKAIDSGWCGRPGRP